MVDIILWNKTDCLRANLNGEAYKCVFSGHIIRPADVSWNDEESIAAYDTKKSDRLFETRLRAKETSRSQAQAAVRYAVKALLGWPAS